MFEWCLELQLKAVAFVAFALIATGIIATALFIPQGAAIIPLNVNYVVGEKMVYDATSSAVYFFGDSNSDSLRNFIPDNVSSSYQLSVEVTDFDGQFYTLNYTTIVQHDDKSMCYSIIDRMNKTGYSCFLFHFANQSGGMPFGIKRSLVQLLSNSEVRVGESVTVPFPSSILSPGITGNITLTFRGFEDLTVPAGTCRVFRVDVGTGDQGLNYDIPAGTWLGSNPNSSSTIQIKMDSQIYLEYGTMRQIKSIMQQIVTQQSTTMNFTVNMENNMTLKEQLRP
jgi:hypothetical protein